MTGGHLSALQRPLNHLEGDGFVTPEVRRSSRHKRFMDVHRRLQPALRLTIYQKPSAEVLKNELRFAALGT